MIPSKSSPTRRAMMKTWIRIALTGVWKVWLRLPKMVGASPTWCGFGCGFGSGERTVRRKRHTHSRLREAAARSRRGRLGHP